MVEEYIGTSWQTKKEILNQMRSDGIQISERSFRKTIEKLNELFFQRETDYYIVHSSQGYKKSQDVEDIIQSIKDLHNRALNMLLKESKAKKALKEMINISFDW